MSAPPLRLYGDIGANAARNSADRVGYLLTPAAHDRTLRRLPAPITCGELAIEAPIFFSGNPS
jgi:hypothetical protein